MTISLPESRAERVELVQKLRRQGLKYREIMDLTGIPRTTIGQYLNDPDRIRLKTRKHRLGDPCVDCGARTSSGSGYKRTPEPRCIPCEQARRRVEHDKMAQRVIALWADGLTLREIAVEMGWKNLKTAQAFIWKLRGEGYDLPHRVPAERLANIRAANREFQIRRAATKWVRQ